MLIALEVGILTLSATIGPLVALVSAAIYLRLVGVRTRAAGLWAATDNYSAIKDTSYNRRSCAGGLWKRNSSCVKGSIARVVGEVESRHGEV